MEDKNLKDVIYFNKISYYEIDDKDVKETIDKMIDEIQSQNLTNLILLYEDAHFNIIYPSLRGVSFEIDTNLPNDLSGKLTAIFTKFHYSK